MPGYSPEIVACSAAMRAALGAVSAAAAARAGVLFHGETGAGRRFLARELHRLAGTAGPFVAVDCGEGTVEELEDVLFGGPGDAAAPDATRRPDRIAARSSLAAALDGTLFLEHLADMPVRIQARLARVLRDGEVLVGDDDSPRPLRLRAVGSAGPGWDEAVEEGRVRPDLFKRTAVCRVDVPPLRERREDIPLLAASLLEAECAARGLPAKVLDEPALTLLTALPWKENVGELKALLLTLVIRVPHDVIGLDDVLDLVRLDWGARPVAAAGTLREARHRFEREYVGAVLAHHKGRVADAARTLGIQRTNLYRKLRELRLSPRVQ